MLVLEKNQRLHIIHMNDLHSHFPNMPKISTYIKRVKEEATVQGEHVLVVDLGDHMDRMQIETEGTFGKANIEILNSFGTDVTTIGNNEGLTFTKELLQQAYKHKQFHVVVCNIKDQNTGETPNWFKEYWIQEVGDLKIGWIGATAPYETFYRLQGWKVEEPLTSIQRSIQSIKDQVDIIILLSHLGFKADEYIAEMVPEIDVILGAHTHRFFEQGIQKEKQPLICQVGIYGDFVGHLTIDYQFEKKHIKQISEKTVDIRQLPEDKLVTNLINNNRAQAQKEMNQTVAYIHDSLPIALDKETVLGNLLADGVRMWVDAEIGLINSGQILEGLESGAISKKRIHEICPSPINACRLTLSGKQVKATLEQSLLDEFIYKSFKGYGFRGAQLGALSISGVEVYYNPSAAPYQKIKQILLNNNPLIDEKEYSIGTLDMFTFGGGYFLIKEGKNIQYFLPEFLRDILAYQLTNEHLIKDSHQLRWKKANEKDRVQ